MQPLKILNEWLSKQPSSKHGLFMINDLRGLFPDLSNAAFKTLLSRAVRKGVLDKVCRGVFFYKSNAVHDGLMLYHVAALKRANQFNYISLETVLSDAGVISQIPINKISIMSSGRSNDISCDQFGTIEFVHTSRKPSEIINHLTYDANCGLWRADVYLALKDMKNTRRNCDLIDWENANEFIRQVGK